MDVTKNWKLTCHNYGVLILVVSVFITTSFSATMTSSNQENEEHRTPANILRFRPKIQLNPKTDDIRLAYCGAESIQPLKDLACSQICPDGLCRNFYCECPNQPTDDHDCLVAPQETKCDNYCSKANFVEAFLCPSASTSSSENNNNIDKKYCMCS